MKRGELHGTNVLSLAVSHFQLTDTVHGRNAEAPAHYHALPLICLVLQGSFDERIGGRRRELASATGLVRPTGEVHANRFGSAGARCLTVEIDSQWFAVFEDHLGTRVGSQVLERGASVKAIAELTAAFRAEEPERSLAAEGALLGLMLDVSRVVRSQRAEATPRAIGRAREFIAANLDGTLTVERIAAAAGIHPVHLARTFRAKTGETVGGYVRRVRAECARDLIGRSAEPLAAIALRCGFADQSHMTRVMRRLFGVTPAKFRR
ncbi:MAG TPA: AraC family transcriptional regulator [Thermoanaerobaculia bacterium]